MKKYRNSISMSNSLDELYNEYRNRVSGKIRYLRGKGITPKDVEPLSKMGFKRAFDAYKLENKKISASGAVDKIVSTELRTASQKQAMNVEKESKMPGSHYKRQYTVLEAMYGGTIWEEVKDVYWDKKGEGLSSTEAKHYIAVTFFGSPE